MVRLTSSDNALRALVLLSQGAEVRVSELATSLGISYTGAERALDILVADGLVERRGHRSAFEPSARTSAVVKTALALLPVEHALAAIGLGNIAVEFVGIDDAGALIVIHRFARPADEARLLASVTSLRELRPGLVVDVVRKEDLLAGAPEPARRGRKPAMRPLVGQPERTFPDPDSARREGQPLGRLNSAVAPASERRLRTFARRHGLRRIVAFGSATRDDLRPDSDLDLLVTPASGGGLGIRQRVGLAVEAARLFDRDVDVVVAPVRRPALAARIAREGVVLYDSAR